MGTETVIIENNQVQITGAIVSDYEYSHEIYGEGFYQFFVEIPRLSESVDTIPIMISERLININEDSTGALITIKGQYRSYNRHERNVNRLILYVFAREAEFLDVDVLIANPNNNSIMLDGYICKKPNYRKTPLHREICDFILAVNRPYGKSDYIPCIAWGRNARFVGELEVGQRLAVQGRVQSREYIKKFSEDMSELRVCYEVSTSKVELAKEDKTDEETM